MGLRLDTRLSKYLLEHQLVQVEALEDAVQQQVVHGGALDTLLLELGAIDEAALTAALTVAWQTKVMAPSLLDQPSPEALARLPARMALAMAICPVDIGAGTLHVAVGAPIDRELLDEVGSLVGVPLTPFVVPEIRLLQALHNAYGAPLEERYQSLLRRIDGTLPPSLVQPEPPPPEKPVTVANDDISPAAAATWDIVEALAHLVAQDSREGIAQVAVSFALRFVPFAAVFGIRNGKAIGWHRAGPCEGAQFGAVELVIPNDSVVQQVLDSPSPLLGKPPVTQGNTVFFGWIGRRRPRTALLIPIVVAQRTVGVLYADGGVRPREIQFLSELVSFGARIGPAFEALLRARHRATAELVQSSTAHPTDSVVEVKPKRDGTSPFALDYTGPSGLGAPATPKVAPMPPPDASSSTSMMPVDASSLSNDARQAPPAAGTSGTLDDQAHPEEEDVSLDLSLEPANAGPDIGFSNVDLNADARPSGPNDVVEHRKDEQALSDKQDDEWGDEQEDEWDDIVLPDSTNLEPVERSASTRIQLPELAELTAAKKPSEEKPTPFASLVAEEAPHEDSDVVVSAVKTKPLFAGLQISPEALAELDAEPNEPVAQIEALPDDANGVKIDPATRPPQEAWPEENDEEPHASVELLSYDERTETNVEIDLGHNITLAGDVPATSTAASDDTTISKDANDTPKTVALPPPPPAEEREKLPEEWVEDLESLNAERVDLAKAALLKLGKTGLNALTRRFPGRLVLDPFGPGKRPSTAKEIGPLLEVVHALGSEGLFAAIPHLNSKHASRRFAAVFVFRLSLDERAIDLLPGLLHDREPRIRVLAAETLAGLMAHPRFEAVLTGVRAMLKSPARDAQLRGVQLLGTFKDVASVPTLISYVEERHADLSLASRSALMEITLQDFGTKTKPWRKWWEKARKVSRIDWLIDGLDSGDRDIRKQAITELRALAGSDFGFRVDDSPRQRSSASQAMGNWWAERKRAMGW